MGKGKNEITCLRSRHESGGKCRRSGASHAGRDSPEELRPLSDPPATRIAAAGSALRLCAQPQAPRGAAGGGAIITVSASRSAGPVKTVTKHLQGHRHRHGRAELLWVYAVPTVQGTAMGPNSLLCILSQSLHFNPQENPAAWALGAPFSRMGNTDSGKHKDRVKANRQRHTRSRLKASPRLLSTTIPEAQVCVKCPSGLPTKPSYS